MFAVTQRLFLRPGWVEDAPQLAAAIAELRAVCNLSRTPWPEPFEDVDAFLSKPSDIWHPSFLIFERTVDPVLLIGSVGFRDCDGVPELCYWIAPDHWDRGFASEAAHAAVEAVRASLGYRRIVARHLTDNPASDRVLEKLGFRNVSCSEKCYSRGRDGPSHYTLGAQEIQPRLSDIGAAALSR
ncbi:GNAT family N-acetyltransferase [Parasphingopyxis lamellibrachiae]|uniref:RimJ/RimL family protein N-acetyltransferase n=1 Tax=Parasphingopyxis lamellibrachiae TaxID=680125 RepID=A0A3D9FJ44_9SPHN|nr:GNAT family protein [Parasphingopyxis lamellibrachiae]RED17815.1 RimJ/RimL family protein N-acetyltransferase [Parasphingopyxis lamellibrachiae]